MTDSSQAPEAPEAIETIQVDNLNQFVEYLMRWHTTKCNVVRHMQSIPEETGVEFNGEELILAGDLRKGFQLGLTVALSELGTLPFAVEAVEETPPAANEAKAD